MSTIHTMSLELEDSRPASRAAVNSMLLPSELLVIRKPYNSFSLYENIFKLIPDLLKSGELLIQRDIDINDIVINRLIVMHSMAMIVISVIDDRVHLVIEDGSDIIVNRDCLEQAIVCDRNAVALVLNKA